MSSPCYHLDMRLAALAIFILSAAFHSQSAWADSILVTGISRASNYNLPTDTDNAKIWGGIVGADCSASATTTTTCNNCTTTYDDGTKACNEHRIHSSLVLRVEFSVTGDITGTVRVGFDKNGFTSATPSSVTSGTLSQGSTGYVEIPWSQICSSATEGADATCTTGGTTELVIGVSTSSEPSTSERTDIPVVVAIPDGSYDLVTCADAAPSSGICSFYAYPGDQKVYLQDLDPVGSYPLSNNLNLKYLRVYFTTDSVDRFAAANYTSSQYVDLDIPEDGVPTPGVVDGLTNDETYFFRSAVIDEAGNIAFLIDVGEIESNTACAAGTFDDLNCLMAATPSKVLGLLTEDVNCFISTAAFGSSFAPQVQTFRDFRNRLLLTSNFGKKLNYLYYNYGPKGALFLHDHPALKPVARALLYPFLWFAQISLKVNLWAGLAFLMGFSFLIALTVWSLGCVGSLGYRRLRHWMA